VSPQRSWRISSTMASFRQGPWQRSGGY
jgi:hypothetical protein